jgi:hypothetical protein
MMHYYPFVEFVDGMVNMMQGQWEPHWPGLCVPKSSPCSCLSDPSSGRRVQALQQRCRHSAVSQRRNK